MKKILLGLMILVGMAQVAVCQDIEKNVWSVEMVNSQIKRHPQAWMIDSSVAPKWSYVMGLELESFIETGQAYNDPRIVDYAVAYADTMVNDRGEIRTYKPTEYNIDHINSGKMLFMVLDITGDPKYRKALDLLYSQFEHHPRTAEGVFWHKKVYPHQMWLDGQYMGLPFLAQYASRFVENPAPIYDDIISQFETVAKHTFDPATGLFRHAYDDSKSMPWADPKTGQSQHAWGRAMGWYMMALVDVLDYIPSDHPKRGQLTDLLICAAAGVAKYQDPATGLWYQVLDQPGRQGNYLEATCSAMFSYSLLKAVRKGYIAQDLIEVGIKGYQGIIDNLIRRDADGTISLERCCLVAGLGGSNNRDGSFEYYIGERIVENDPKGVGPFIKASLEIEMFK